MEILLSAVIILSCFYVLAIISEDYFVPAIDRLAHRLKLGSDAAGATLLAMGSSAPELFTSLFAVLGSSGENANVGAGAIVGSAIFNVLVIIGVAATFKAVKLQWQPVIRDMIFYIVTILLLFMAFRDGFVDLTEAIIFVSVYVGYIIAVINWRKFFPYNDVDASDILESQPDNSFTQFIKSLLSLAIPNPEKHPDRYLITFFTSIIAIAGLSFLLVENIIHIADAASINPTFLALTVLAAGTSVPDLIGSIVVAKQGRGDMAVSNAVGSNIFDVLFGLGAPWLIVILARGETVQVSTDNLNASIFLLFATVVALLFLMFARNWKISHKSGFALIALYAGYLIYTWFTVA